MSEGIGWWYATAEPGKRTLVTGAGALRVRGPSGQ